MGIYDHLRLFVSFAERKSFSYCLKYRQFVIKGGIEKDLFLFSFQMDMNNDYPFFLLMLSLIFSTRVFEDMIAIILESSS